MAWVKERLKEPSTYQGLSILAGIFGQWAFGSPAVGEAIFQCGVGLAAAIEVGKREPLEGRDFNQN
jgi:hypothetical protein